MVILCPHFDMQDWVPDLLPILFVYQITWDLIERSDLLTDHSSASVHTRTPLPSSKLFGFDPSIDPFGIGLG